MYGMALDDAPFQPGRLLHKCQQLPAGYSRLREKTIARCHCVLRINDLQAKRTGNSGQPLTPLCRAGFFERVGLDNLGGVINGYVMVIDDGIVMELGQSHGLVHPFAFDLTSH